MNWEHPNVQAEFRKDRGTRDQIGSLKKQENSRKISTSASLTTLNPLTVWITTNRGQFWKRWEYQTTWPASCKTYIQVRKPQLELDMLTRHWFQIGKGVRQGCIFLPCLCNIFLSYLFNLYAEYIMRMAGLYEAQAGIKMPGEISITSDMQMIPPLWQKVKT